MDRKFLIILSALFVTAMVAFAVLRARLEDQPGGSQPEESVRVAHRDATPPRSFMEAAAVVSEKSAPEIAELTAHIQQLQNQLDYLMRTTTHPNGSDDASPSASTPPESEEQERQRTVQTTAFLHDNFATERKDPVWSLRAERQVSDAFNLDEISAGSQLHQLSCQATLCRIESRYQDENAERAFLTRLGRLESFGDAEAFSERFERPDGSIEAVTYVSRSGHHLPRMQVPE